MWGFCMLGRLCVPWCSLQWSSWNEVCSSFPISVCMFTVSNVCSYWVLQWLFAGGAIWNLMWNLCSTGWPNSECHHKPFRISDISPYTKCNFKILNLRFILLHKNTDLHTRLFSSSRKLLIRMCNTNKLCL